jgi:hypothetical protein
MPVITKPGFAAAVQVEVPLKALGVVQTTLPPFVGDACAVGVTIAVKLAITVQSAVTGSVVYVVPLKLPPHVPPTGITVKLPALGVIVTVPLLLNVTAPPPVAVPLPLPTLAVTVYCRGAEQLAVPPPPTPAQDQVNWLAAVDTTLAVPAAHKFAAGATSDATPFAVPHVPATIGEKLAITVQSAVTGAVVKVVPESVPPQVPPTGVTVKKPADGVIVTVPVLLNVTAPPPVAVPLPPETLAVTVYCRGAAQLAFAPPPLPSQVHVNCPAAEATALAVPAVQRSAIGATSVATPFAVPHAPFTGTRNVLVSVALLLLGVGSGVELVTVAVLESVPVARGEIAQAAV